MNENRRGFMTWAASLLGLGAVSEIAEAKPESKKTRGFICLTLNVGQLPPFKAEVFVDKMRDQWIKNGLRKSLEDWELLVMPVRPPQETKIEVFDLSATRTTRDVFVKAQKLIRDEIPFVAPDKAKTLDHVLFHLGAPITHVELNQSQLDMAYDETKQLFDHVANAKGISNINMGGMGQEVFKGMVKAKAEIMLGHIRRKWQDKQKPLELDGDEMLAEGTNNLHYWMEYLRNV